MSRSEEMPAILSFLSSLAWILFVFRKHATVNTLKDFIELFNECFIQFADYKNYCE